MDDLFTDLANESRTLEDPLQVVAQTQVNFSHTPRA